MIIRAITPAQVECHPQPCQNPVRVHSSSRLKKSTRTAGARGSAWAASPRCVRMRWIVAGFSMAAMSFSCHHNAGIVQCRYQTHASTIKPNACAPSRSRPTCGRHRSRVPMRSPPAAPASLPCAVSHSMPALHQSGLGAIAVVASARQGVA